MPKHWMPKLVEWTQEIDNIRELAENTWPVRHDVLSPNFTRTRYANGLEVYVNSGAITRKIDGIVIKPQDYEIISPDGYQ